MDTGEVLQRLGYKPDAKLCIISCDYLGFSHSFNLGVFDAMRNGVATCARLVLNAPWSREVNALYRGEDVGVALALTSDHDIFRMAPLTQSPTLVDGTGELPKTLEEFWEHGDTAEVRRECRAQIERAIFYGFDPSHLASEAQALTLRPEFFDVLLDVALEFGLPLRIPVEHDINHYAFPAASVAAEEGVICPNAQVCLFDSGHTSAEASREALSVVAAALEPGVTEISFRPAVASAELEALMGEEYVRYLKAYELLTDKHTAEIFADHHIALVGYRELKKIQAETIGQTT